MGADLSSPRISGTQHELYSLRLSLSLAYIFPLTTALLSQGNWEEQLPHTGPGTRPPPMLPPHMVPAPYCGPYFHAHMWGRH